MTSLRVVKQHNCHRSLASITKDNMVETRRQRLRRRWDAVEGAQGVFIDILSRIPVKSSQSFKTINRYWHRSISNKYFAVQQITRSRKHLSYISCPRMDRRMNLFLVKPGRFTLSKLSTIDPSQRCDTEYMYMISSFNGLICCINQICDEDESNAFWDLQIWICNPCTEETLLLPQGRPSFEVEPSVGVAYGSDISDYKVFRIYCAGKKSLEESISREVYMRQGHYAHYAYECEVYSSSTGVWKNLGPVPCVPMRSSLRPYRYGHVSARGKVYWLVSLYDPGAILSVDWEGKFEVIRLPQYEDHLRWEDSITDATFLIILEESLALVVLHADDMDVWVWKEDNEKSSWVLLCQDYIPFDDYDLVLAVTSSKNQILCVTETHWYTYDVDTGIWNRKRANKAGFANPAVYPFTESLLPCNGGVQLLKEQ